MSKTTVELAENKKKFSPATAAYLAKVPDSVQYPVAGNPKGWYSHMGSSSVESLNNHLGELREMPFVDSLLASAALIQRRHRTNKASAQRHAALGALLPPKVEGEMRPHREWAAQMPPHLVTLSEDGETAMVKSTANANLWRVKFGAFTNRVGDTACDKGCGMQTTVCPHMLAACRKKNVAVESLMNPKDTTAGWTEQYEGTIELPSTRDIESFMHLRDESLLLPPALKRKAGRPSKRKRIRGGLEKGMKRKMTCGICGKNHGKHQCPTVVPCALCKQKGHFKRDCPSSTKK
jgi:hypothetical protein